jgi:hypothetical protein
VYGKWNEAKNLIEGMLAEPWHLRGYQETRLRKFLQVVEINHPFVVAVL